MASHGQCSNLSMKWIHLKKFPLRAPYYDNEYHLSSKRGKTLHLLLKSSKDQVYPHILGMPQPRTLLIVKTSGWRLAWNLTCVDHKVNQGEAYYAYSWRGGGMKPKVHDNDHLMRYDGSWYLRVGEIPKMWGRTCKNFILGKPSALGFTLHKILPHNCPRVQR